jgi:hypothetical protein
LDCVRHEQSTAVHSSARQIERTKKGQNLQREERGLERWEGSTEDTDNREERDTERLQEETDKEKGRQDSLQRRTS